MAQQAPEGLDVTELKFKLQSKVPLFKGNGTAKDNCNLLAAASVHGLVFAGTIGPELRVLRLRDITVEQAVNEVVPLRTVPLPSEPFQLAVSCDHGFLAVDVVSNGVPFIYVYSVPSFLTGSVAKLHEIRTSPQPGVRCTQICWNPVIHNMFSVRTEAGGLSVYTLKEPTGLEFHSLDGNSEHAQFACWSPKGKQLVVAFANGKLVQYKPDLKPARTIVCPPGVVEGGGSFDVLAVQWLSTYQFAAVFLPHAPDSVPALFIVNAPKVGGPVLINYDDVCYSQSGPRKGQVFLLHILPWNLLLMASANSMEVGILGTTETGEAPTWCQWTTTDEARAELPLTVDKQESFPIGFALETGCTHELVISEQVFPVMPMIHLLSTYGQLVSFNVLNTMPNATNICSPPKPAQDLTGGAFVKLDFGSLSNSTPPGPGPTAGVTPSAMGNVPPMGSSANQQSSELSFAVPNGATSTPAVPKTKSFFNAGLGTIDPAVQKSPVNLFGSVAGQQQQKPSPAATIAPTFGKQITFGSPQPAAQFGGGEAKASPFGSFAASSATSGGGVGFGSLGNTLGTSPGGLPTMSAPPFQSAMASMAPASIPPSSAGAPSTPGPEASKPLVTVPPTYVPPTPSQQPGTGQTHPTGGSSAPQARPTKKADLSSSEDNNAIIRALTVDELKRFARELADLQQRSRSANVQIGTKEESAGMIRSLRELEDIIAQANESTESLVADVQALRLGLNEAFAMVAEATSKSAIYSDPTMHQYQESHVMSQTSRRQLASLESMLQVNENQLRTVTKQLGAQWMALEEAKQTHVRQRMHIPSLEVLYQTLSKQQEILNRQSEKLGCLKHKLGMKSSLKGLDDGTANRTAVPQQLHRQQNYDDEGAIESLTDSILSMTLGDQVAADAKKLSESKLAALRKVLAGRRVVTVKPQRPDRVGLSSEVVRERRDVVRRQNVEQDRTKAPHTGPSQLAGVGKRDADQRKQQQQQQMQQQAQRQQQQQRQQTAQQQSQQPAGTSSTVKPAFAFPAQTSIGAGGGGGAGAGSFSFGQTTITPMAAAAADTANKPPLTAGGNISTGLSFGAANANKEYAEKRDSFAAKENVPPAAAPLAKSSSSSLFSFGSAVGGTPSSGTAFKPPSETSTVAAAAAPAGGGGGMSGGKSIFSFAGGTTGGTAGGAQAAPPAMSFGSVAKPSFSFDPSSSFGNGNATLSFGTGPPAAEGPLNLGKPKQQSNETNPAPPVVDDENARKDKPLPPSFGPAPDSTPTKAPLPALTSLLQKVDPSVTVDSTVKVVPAPKPLTASVAGAPSTGSGGGLFGSSTSSGAGSFEGGLFGSISARGGDNGNTLVDGGSSGTPPKAGGSLFSGVTFGSTTITPVVASSSPATGFGTSPATATSGGSFFGTSMAGSTGFGSGAASFTAPSALGTATVSSSSSSKPEGAAEPPVVVSAFGSPVASGVSSTTTAAPVATSAGSGGGFSFGSITASLEKSLPVAPVAATASVGSVLPATPVNAASPPPPTAASSTTSTDPTSGLFGSISICSPSSAAAATSPTSAATGNIFSSSAFSAPKPSGAGADTTASIFGGGGGGAAAAAASTAGGSIFAAAAKPVASVPSPFGGGAATGTAASGGLFGSISSPTATTTPVSTGGGSLFGSIASNGTTTATTVPARGSIFGGAAATGGGGFFGTATSTAANSGGFATTTNTGGSMFGASATTNSGAPAGGNIFAAAATGGGSGGLFGSVAGGANNNNNNAATSPSAAGGGGSIFAGTSAFGSGGGANIFASPSSAAGPPGASSGSTGGLFGSVGAGSGGAPFGSPPQGTATGMFGGVSSAASAGATTASPFGAPSGGGAFGSPSGGGAASAFSKPASAFGGGGGVGAGTGGFGGAPTFGGGATFGGAPTFGGAATFGSPKGTFGGGSAFGVGPTPAPAAIGSPTQSNNLFEQLGTSSSGVSFGGLAQQQAAKPTQFGGSSFSSWRS